MVHCDLTFRVFVSSPFSDMAVERDALRAEVFSKLHEYCQRRGVYFQPIELRWDLPEKRALCHQAMNTCVRALQCHRQLLLRPCFVVLLGDRYGWRALPPQIQAFEFEALLARLSKEEEENLLRWYRRDDNAVPPEYCLLLRTGDFVDEDQWATEEAELRAILLKAVEQTLATDVPERRKYYDSATHQEIHHGALEVSDPHSHVFCYFRRIRGLPGDHSAGQYRDIHDGQPDREAQDRLAALKAELERRLPVDHVRYYEAIWEDDHPDWDLSSLCEGMARDLSRVVDQELAAYELQSDLEWESEAHREFAEDRCRHFLGRQDLLQRIRDYLASDESAPLVIHGRCGSGKTALMAKAWLDSAKERNTVARFIGATPRSSDLCTLLAGLCQQMDVQGVPTDTDELVRVFRESLSPPNENETTPGERVPVVLFLDALDQLSPADSAHTLYWLPRELATNVKLVLSVLETDSGAEVNPASRVDCFDVAGRIWPGRLTELRPLDAAAGAELLNAWLAEAGRTLQPRQREDVLGKFQRCPLPLYLKLAFEEARRWKSWEDMPCGADAMPRLSDSLEGVLGNLFSRLERERGRGRTFCSRALGYIAASKNGLTEEELLDVLSADREVMAELFARCPESSRVDRIPAVIWLRLLTDIEPYMTRRRADGTILIDFYHCQIREAIQKRYLAVDQARVRAHLHLAEYFSTLDYWAESITAQRARARRLPPTPRPANVRKVVELPYHRLEAAKAAGKDDPKSPYWDAVADLLTDWQFLEAKAEADPNFTRRNPRDFAS